jgi:hypothetical protein
VGGLYVLTVAVRCSAGSFGFDYFFWQQNDKLTGCLKLEHTFFGYRKLCKTEQGEAVNKASRCLHKSFNFALGHGDFPWALADFKSIWPAPQVLLGMCGLVCTVEPLVGCTSPVPVPNKFPEFEKMVSDFP